jgi:hypothetical protein
MAITEYIYIYRVIKSLCAPDDNSTLYSNNAHTTDDLKMTITEYIRNVDRAVLNTVCAILNTDRAVLNTVFEKRFRRVNKYLETGGGHFEHYL